MGSCSATNDDERMTWRRAPSHASHGSESRKCIGARRRACAAALQQALVEGVRRWRVQPCGQLPGVAVRLRAARSSAAASSAACEGARWRQGARRVTDKQMCRRRDVSLCGCTAAGAARRAIGARPASAGVGRVTHAAAARAAAACAAQRRRHCPEKREARSSTSGRGAPWARTRRPHWRDEHARRCGCGCHGPRGWPARPAVPCCVPGLVLACGDGATAGVACCRQAAPRARPEPVHGTTTSGWWPHRLGVTWPNMAPARWCRRRPRGTLP